MTYDEGLAQRVRELLQEKPGFDEKKMFGGVCFLLNGNYEMRYEKKCLNVKDLDESSKYFFSMAYF